MRQSLSDFKTLFLILKSTIMKKRTLFYALFVLFSLFAINSRGESRNYYKQNLLKYSGQISVFNNTSSAVVGAVGAGTYGFSPSWPLSGGEYGTASYYSFSPSAAIDVYLSYVAPGEDVMILLYYDGGVQESIVVSSAGNHLIAPSRFLDGSVDDFEIHIM